MSKVHFDSCKNGMVTAPLQVGRPRLSGVLRRNARGLVSGDPGTWAALRLPAPPARRPLRPGHGRGQSLADEAAVPAVAVPAEARPPLGRDRAPPGAQACHVTRVNTARASGLGVEVGFRLGSAGLSWPEPQAARVPGRAGGRAEGGEGRSLPPACPPGASASGLALPGAHRAHRALCLKLLRAAFSATGHQDCPNGCTGLVLPPVSGSALSRD